MPQACKRWAASGLPPPPLKRAVPEPTPQVRELLGEKNALLDRAAALQERLGRCAGGGAAAGQAAVARGPCGVPVTRHAGLGELQSSIASLSCQSYAPPPL